MPLVGARMDETAGGTRPSRDGSGGTSVALPLAPAAGMPGGPLSPTASERADSPVALSKEDTVNTATAAPSSEPRASQVALLPETMGADLTDCGSPAVHSDSTVGYDPTLLVASLEEVAARQAAIEWLLDADLLCVCLA